MASAAAAGPVHEAVLATLTVALAPLRFDIGPAGTLGALTVYDGVAAQRPAYPYVVLGGSSTERPYHTLGPTSGAKFGGQVRIPVRIVTQYPTSEAQTYALLSTVKAALDQQPLTVQGFGRGAVTVEDSTLLSDVIGGVVTRELVAEIDVLVHQG